MPEIDLALVWAMLIAFAVLAYVALDGFDLGIGILFPFLGDEHQQTVAMNTVAPVWDGNETWLVLGGGGLLAVFPLAYAIILPALYAPMIAMLLALVLRGVAFEFRGRTKRGRFLWDASFFGGSLVAGLSQGIILGALLQGIPVADRGYAGGWWDWFTPFSLVTGIALVTGYAMLGSTWLVLKTEGDLQRRARAFAQPAALATFVLIGVFSLWTPLLQLEYMERWFTMPELVFVLPVPVLVVVCTVLLLRSLREQRELAPFLYAEGLFLLSYIGLGISFYPYMVPPYITIWDAAAPDSSLLFLLVGAMILLPIIIGYTAYAYWIFRGKVDPDEGYH
ncbi:MAG: cytochrome d ubiquinol oxidase subunit II [Pseudomonadales bacterium]